jgi:hypothetical protein
MDQISARSLFSTDAASPCYKHKMLITYILSRNNFVTLQLADTESEIEKAVEECVPTGNISRTTSTYCTSK